MGHLTVAQNIFIGREPRRGFWLDEKQLNRKAAELFEELHIRLDPRARVSGLAVAQQQMVEIAKALSFNSDVLIMDEPTAALTETEIDELFRITRILRERGHGIVHISHRLEELKVITDRVTVMRDGKYIDTVITADATIQQIISMMVGRTIFEEAPELPENPSPEVVLEVRGLNRGRAIRDVSFKLHRGEILGVAGLVGAGRTEVMRAVFGADSHDSGEILVHGQPGDHPDAQRRGAPRDRLPVGGPQAVRPRAADGRRGQHRDGQPPEVHRRARAGSTSARPGRRPSSTSRASRSRRPASSQRTKNLSGGNQQKVVIAKWLTADTEILIFDEPTRGIDVGAKSEIYRLLNDLAQEGKAIIMVSSELPEILRMSHRILVMCEGRITGELAAGEATQERIMTFATQRESIAAA